MELPKPWTESKAALDLAFSKTLFGFAIAPPFLLDQNSHTITLSRRTAAERPGHWKARTKHRAPLYMHPAFSTSAECHSYYISRKLPARSILVTNVWPTKHGLGMFAACRAWEFGDVRKACQTWRCDNCIFCSSRWAVELLICWRFTLLHLLLHRTTRLRINKPLPRQNL